MQQFNTLKLRNELLKNLSFPETEKHIIVTETNKKILSLAFFPFFQNFIYFSISCKSVSSATPSLKVTAQFETEGNGQNEIVSHVDRSEVNLSISEKSIVISHIQNEILKQKHFTGSGFEGTPKL